MTPFVIAEIGINFNGSLENCFKMIDSAADAGCNAVKFQLFSARNLYPKSAGNLDWKDDGKEYSYDIYEAASKFELPEEWIKKLVSYCEEKNIDFMSSIFSIQDLELALSKGMKKVKLSSYSITNIPLIEATAKTGLPTIMSTGGATISETEEAIEAFLRYSFKDKLTILHCSIQYPTDLKDVNMGVLDTFKYAFPGIEYGYSDHTFEVSDAPIQAVYLGAKVIEKHITLDKKMEGPDHFFALEPQELKQMVEDIKKAEQDLKNNDFEIDKIIYGNTAKICHEHERYLRDFAYMTLFVKKPIKKGEVIKAENLSILRPGKKERGLEPKFLELFEKKEIIATKDLKFEESVLEENIAVNRRNVYDMWNDLKQGIESKKISANFKEREIFFSNLGHNIGFEQNGIGKHYLRPVLIIKKFSNNVFLGVPLTTSSKLNRFHYKFSFLKDKDKDSYAILSQVRLFDSKRLERKIGVINKKNFFELKDKLVKLIEV